MVVCSTVLAGCSSRQEGTGSTAPSESTASSESTAQPKVQRLVFATIAPTVESNETRHIGLAMWHLKPMYEYLIGINAENGQMIPQLATSWSLEPDGTSFRFKLRAGVPFHKNYGDFTSKDLVNPWREVIREDTQAGTAPYWRQVLQDIETVSPGEAVYRLKRPDGSFLYSLSYGRAAMELYSSAHFAAAGPPVNFEAGPLSGTGPYQFQARQPASFIRYERVPYKHWQSTPDFAEFEFRFMKEPSTRLAGLLAGEVHMADLPQDLRVQAKQRGDKGISAKVSALRTWMSHLCCYLNEPTNPAKGWLYPDSPLMDTRVRRALSKAINREELNKAFFQGEAKPMVLPHFSPSRDGWNPDWERRLQEEYGYDPVAAKRLLAEVGYGSDRPLTTHIQVQSATGYAGAEDMAEAIASMWRAVGVNVILLTADRAEFDRLTRAFKWDNHTLINGSGSEQWTGSTVFGSTQGGRWNGVQLPKVDGLLARIGATLNEKEQDRLWREVGEEVFTSHKEIPLFWLPIEIIVDPKIVGGWVFPGSLTGSWTHVENIKAAR